ncbi:MAG: ComF family protein [Saprospiraceae bacterium]|nr:ComF family protein [Saprospiraceae bacterium]
MGLSESLECPTREDILIRTKETITQTTKNRIERNQNIQAAFKLQRPDLVKGRHVLLVDDILTTGATLESCALTLQQSELVSISMATIAMTS